jgi:hypothetical protein
VAVEGGNWGLSRSKTSLGSLLEVGKMLHNEFDRKSSCRGELRKSAESTDKLTVLHCLECLLNFDTSIRSLRSFILACDLRWINQRKESRVISEYLSGQRKDHACAFPTTSAGSFHSSCPDQQPGPWLTFEAADLYTRMIVRRVVKRRTWTTLAHTTSQIRFSETSVSVTFSRCLLVQPRPPAGRRLISFNV